MPNLKPFRRHLAKLFEVVVSPSKKKESSFLLPSLYTQAVAYTTYVESAARRALKNTSKRRLLSLGSLLHGTLLRFSDLSGSIASLLFIQIQAIERPLNVNHVAIFIEITNFFSDHVLNIESLRKRGNFLEFIMKRISHKVNSRLTLL